MKEPMKDSMRDLKLRKLKNKLFHMALVLSALIVIAPLFLVVLYLLGKGASGVNLDFFTEIPKPVGEPGGGMLHAIVGTFIMVTLGSLISIPVGILAGVLLSEFEKGPIQTALRFATDLLAGVPSIVIGIFGYLLVVVPFKSFSALAGALSLSLIILPIVTRSTEEILKLVPNHVREAGLALGIPRWKVIFFIIVRGSLSKLFTGIILAISRAAGETAPLLFTAFGSLYLSYNVKEPMASLPVQIYNYAISPFDDWQAQAWTAAFVLILIVLGLNLTARLVFEIKDYKRK
ncbi:phosphate ABC transporter permease PstA [Halobacteriovorax sp. GB3]|uniref:phosphate ABC transporter permease PstA n=1 Tax=Halobacteriovorax sp. GB3 TaxID=2719615 RepID=UPI0023616760|nr:phosphate ABC transporter permease PstA [Halobacteriovorax sp. GB3]MDD0851966.1 phosphate ABC transporter permease PstA [Halobacteriovorax sp. GB3]